MYPGEYGQPLLRVTTVQAPIVNDYTTIRLRAYQLFPTDPSNVNQLLLHNTGNTPIAVQFVETDDHVSGPRSNVGSAIPVVPGGKVPHEITPTKKYLEVKGVETFIASAGTTTDGDLRLQLSSQVRWDLMAFAKDDPLYPRKLWAPVTYSPAS